VLTYTQGYPQLMGRTHQALVTSMFAQIAYHDFLKIKAAFVMSRVYFSQKISLCCRRFTP